MAVGAVSYIEYENGVQRLMNEFWNYLHAFPKNPALPSAPSSSPSWAQGQAQQPVVQFTAPLPPRSCPSCKSALDSDSKFCKSCGARV